MTVHLWRGWNACSVRQVSGRRPLPLHQGLAAEKAAALSVKTQGTMTDSLLFDIDETLNKVYKELASHQIRLDSFEQHRLEMVSVHRVLSLLPKPVLPSQGEDNYTWDFQEPANNPEN